jgi:DNA repair protein RadC
MDELCRLKGIGEAKGITIIAALELGRRRATSEVLQRNKISSSKDVAGIFQPLLGDLPYEEFWVLLLNRSNYILERLKISQGGIAGTVTDVRIILKTALDKLASSMILVHNHPSGYLIPSDADRKRGWSSASPFIIV